MHRSSISGTGSNVSAANVAYALKQTLSHQAFVSRRRAFRWPHNLARPEIQHIAGRRQREQIQKVLKRRVFGADIRLWYYNDVGHLLGLAKAGRYLPRARRSQGG